MRTNEVGIVSARVRLVKASVRLTQLVLVLFSRSPPDATSDGVGEALCCVGQFSSRGNFITGQCIGTLLIQRRSSHHHSFDG